MRKRVKKILTFINTKLSLRNVGGCGKGVRCNSFCRFTGNTQIGNNCHFNGMYITGKGHVSIGSNFHSGEKIRVLTSFHNYDHGNALPYDNSTYDRDVIIEENVWVGESVMILGGVTIGEGAVIQAGSVVCKDIPPLAIAGGHPAVPFKFREKEHYYKLKKAGKFM